MWKILLKEKSEAFEKFKCFKALAEHETKSVIQTFRTIEAVNSHHMNSEPTVNTKASIGT